MVLPSINIYDTRTVAVLGGGLYTIVVLSWLFSAGMSFSSQGRALVVGVGYAVVGMFLTAAVPLYLFGRLSLISSPLATLWVLGETVYQWLYGAHLHPLSPSFYNIPYLLAITGLGMLTMVVIFYSASRGGVEQASAV